MAAEPPVLLASDLAGTFAFALNGALTAVRSAHLDIVGVVTLGMITAVGGDIIRDILLGALPAGHVRRLALPDSGCRRRADRVPVSRWLSRFTNSIDVLDAAGLSLFAVTGASKAIEFGAG